MIETTNKKENKYSLKSYFKFLIPSFIGILLFMTPIRLDKEITIPVAFFSQNI